MTELTTINFDSFTMTVFLINEVDLVKDVDFAFFKDDKLFGVKINDKTVRS